MIVKDVELTPHLLESCCECGSELEYSYHSCRGTEGDPNNTWDYVCKECGNKYTMHFPPSELKVLVLKDGDGNDVYRINFDTLEKVKNIWSY